jgi:NAD dependent epimerase/dehydratase family enzyme
VVPAPGFALKAILGEFGGEALASQRAVPAALTSAGFTFTHTDLEAALRWALDQRG